MAAVAAAVNELAILHFAWMGSHGMHAIRLAYIAFHRIRIIVSEWILISFRRYSAWNSRAVVIVTFKQCCRRNSISVEFIAMENWINQICVQVDDSDDDDDQRRIGIIKIRRIAHEHSSDGSWFKCLQFMLSARARAILANGREIISYYRIMASMNSFRIFYHPSSACARVKIFVSTLWANGVDYGYYPSSIELSVNVSSSIRKHIEHTWLCA